MRSDRTEKLSVKSLIIFSKYQYYCSVLNSPRKFTTEQKSEPLTLLLFSLILESSDNTAILEIRRQIYYQINPTFAYSTFLRLYISAIFNVVPFTELNNAYARLYKLSLLER